MQREIKFRAYSKTDGGYIVEPVAIYGEHVMVARGSQLVLVPGAIAIQFTGLLDKNGKEIYEGDVVRYVESAFMPTTYNDFPVEWSIGMAGWNLRTDKPYEVIGNIYKNPELLQDKAKFEDRPR